MNVFVDEAGTFQPSSTPDSWSTVVAYVSPEIDRAPLECLVKSLRIECGAGSEVKLGDISESRYCAFLKELSELNGIAFAIATDTHQHTGHQVIQHREAQADKVVEYIDKLVSSSARQSVQVLAVEIRRLPIQLYTQLICQVDLFHKVLCRAITYYAQRYPATLRHLRWRVDRKDIVATAYESAFRTILPALLQDKSLREPMELLTEGADYRFFKRFEYESDHAPSYLKDVYGIEISGRPGNAGKMVGENFQLVDSNAVPGVQVADLLATGLRRAMRCHFDNPETIATLLGACMLQEFDGKTPAQLIAFGDGDDPVVTERTAGILRSMSRYNRRFLAAKNL